VEPAPEADATLPDLPPPELQQVETGAGGREQVEAPDAAPIDGTGKHLTAHGLLPRPRRNILKNILHLQVPSRHHLKKPPGHQRVLEKC
jgi:hypothetical protein